MTDILYSILTMIFKETQQIINHFVEKDKLLYKNRKFLTISANNAKESKKERTIVLHHFDRVCTKRLKLLLNIMTLVFKAYFNNIMKIDKV